MQHDVWFRSPEGELLAVIGPAPRSDAHRDVVVVDPRGGESRSIPAGWLAGMERVPRAVLVAPGSIVEIEGLGRAEVPFDLGGEELLVLELDADGEQTGRECRVPRAEVLAAIAIVECAP
jgi:hypothetical protein